jgi:hypothetical protein
MSVRPGIALVALGTPGILLQLAGLACFLRLRTEHAEIGLFAGLLLFALGTPLTILAVERHARSKGLRDRWALCALLGPVGPIVVAALKPGTHAPAPAPAPPGRRPRSTADAVAGLLLTALIGVGFIWAGARWLSLGPVEREAGPPPMRRNERLAFERLRSIVRGQERYRRQDWDGDGRKTYAAHYIHLWRSVDRQGNPVPVDLIDGELGFAMVATFALDGYFYEDIASREPLAQLRRAERGRGPGAPRSSKLDPAREWAVAARPAAAGKTGVLSFIAESSGTIWTSVPLGERTSPDPAAPRRWIAVRSRAHLEELQRRIAR